jgi:transposase
LVSVTPRRLAQEYELHPAQITQWKKQFLEQSASVFESDKKKNEELEQLKTERDELFRQMGELKFENNWYKKNSNDAAFRKAEACRYAGFRSLRCAPM